MLQSLVFQIHSHSLLDSLDEVAIAIEHGRHAGQNVVVPAFELPKVETFYVHMSEDDKCGILIAGFEELSVQVDWKIMQLLLGIHCTFNFLLRLLVRAGEILGGVVAASGLQRQFLLVLQRDFQGVKAAIELKVLRNESQHIGIVGRGGDAAETFVEIVIVMKENAAGAVCENREQVVLRGSSRGLE